MPMEWKLLLQRSNISKMEQQQHPQAVLDALNYFTSPTNNLLGEQKYMQINSHLQYSPNPSMHFSVDSMIGGTLKPSLSTSSSSGSGGGKSCAVTTGLDGIPIIRGPLGGLHYANASSLAATSQNAKPRKSSDDEDAPPPIPDRPERTKSIYTKAREDDDKDIVRGGLINGLAIDAVYV